MKHFYKNVERIADMCTGIKKTFLRNKKFKLIFQCPKCSVIFTCPNKYCENLVNLNKCIENGTICKDLYGNIVYTRNCYRKKCLRKSLGYYSYISI